MRRPKPSAELQAAELPADLGGAVAVMNEGGSDSDEFEQSIVGKRRL
jgi:hypothetical protein